jgi:hypothetical protein
VASKYKLRVSEDRAGVVEFFAVVGVVAIIGLGVWVWRSPYSSWLTSTPTSTVTVQTSGAAGAAIDGTNTYVQQIGQRDWPALWAAQTPGYHTRFSRAEMESWWGRDVKAVRIWPGRQPTVARTDSGRTWVLVPLEYFRLSDGQLVHQYVYWAFTKQGNQIDEGRSGCITTTVSCKALPLN